MKYVIVGEGNLGKRLYNFMPKGDTEIINQYNFWKRSKQSNEFQESVVIYTSWITQVDYFDDNPIKAFEYMLEFYHNVNKYLNVLKFVFISSNMAERPIPNSYGWSKHFAEQFLLKKMAAKVCIIRTQYLFNGEKEFNYSEAAIDMIIRPMEIGLLCSFIAEYSGEHGIIEFYGPETTMFDFVKNNYNPDVKPILFKDIKFQTNRNKIN